MIDKREIAKTVERVLEGSDLFLVDVNVTDDNEVEVLIDSERDVTVDDCVMINDAVLAEHDRDREDYELTVGSCGLTTPFTVLRQYLKNVGNEVECLTADGRKLRGTLSAADEAGITIATTEKRKLEGKKRPEMVTVEIPLKYSEINYSKNIIEI